MNLVGELPPVNRDTLAFVMLHLKRVAGWKQCLMGVDNLCKIFGPTLIRDSVETNQPLGSNNERARVVLEDSRKQPIVMQRLFEIPEHFWSQFLTPQSKYALDPVNRLMFRVLIV